MLEDDLVQRVSYQDYRDTIRAIYDGPRGAMLLAFSKMSLHFSLGDRLLRTRQFDLAGARRILDVGSGAGQMLQHVLKYADSDARVTAFDLSLGMLRRARSRLKSGAPGYAVADLSRLPFADGSFDCVTCAYVLEHLPDARTGLAELARVTVPGARILLLTTEDNFQGIWTSRMYRCRTYSREELSRASQDAGLVWKRELWLSAMHRIFRAGGICVEVHKRA
jgi:ubiquinone/menaquinone biosynthesis C-methylase UbiE